MKKESAETVAIRIKFRLTAKRRKRTKYKETNIRINK